MGSRLDHYPSARWVFALALACLTMAARQRLAEAPAEAERLFSRDVWPIIQSKCLACHGEDLKKRKGGLDLRTRDGMLKGGEGGPVLVPGQPEMSRLYVAVTRADDELAMPPKENDRLSAEQVEQVRRWIAAGAPWPDPSRPAAVTQRQDAADGIVVATSGGLAEAWNQRRYKAEDVWAYRPIQRPAVPADVIDAPRVKNPIDAFLQGAMKRRGITRLAAEADRRTLVRRATIDLIGLPPAPETVEEFVADRSPDAYERLVARLLASPRYGEQQARHWLDVVRYADTAGFSNDYERPNAWRYRDYVIRSFNSDKPFDRFIIEQIAGDELAPGDPEMLVATGFLRMGPWEQTGMSVAAVTRQQWLDDVTQSIGVSFLAQGLRCAACHDHKFDPVPTRDYYRVQAVFATTYFAERPAQFLAGENVKQDSPAKAEVRRQLQQTRAALAAFRRKNQLAIAAYLKAKGVARAEDLPLDSRPNRGEFGLTKEELTLKKLAQKRADYYERELRRYEPEALAVYSGADNNYGSNKLVNPIPRRTEASSPVVHILTGGALDSPGEPVTPGVLSAVFASNDRAEPSEWNRIPGAAGGRRLALARWIASERNTLTARVIVNRVWQQHFGRGIVATPNNFGKMGAKPTHPELLDYLAAWFIDNGWSIKKLHALIMSTNAYRQAGVHPDMEALLRVDSKNELLACFPPRRLAAEEVRDAALAASGELNPEAGGPGVFPEINREVAFQPRHIMGSVAPAYQPSRTPAERNRRTIYAFRYRTLSDPMLEVFNRPGSETSCERRDETTITPQAFSLMNSEFSANRALAMAAFLRENAKDLDGQIGLALRRVYGRAPTDAELARCREHVRRMTEHHRANAPQPVALPTKVRRHMVEEMTGESIEWEEELDGPRDYQRDRMPWEVDPETRGLAELCLVLLNSNEFLYLR
jgi:cytochrome c553